MPKVDDIMRSAEIQTSSKDKMVNIEFVYEAPGAKEVYLAGSFNSWDPHALLMKRNKLGQWKTSVKLVPGRYEYKFVADGNWSMDPRCTEVTVNGEGIRNCVISVAPKMAA